MDRSSRSWRRRRSCWMASIWKPPHPPTTRTRGCGTYCWSDIPTVPSSAVRRAPTFPAASVSSPLRRPSVCVTGCTVSMAISISNRPNARSISNASTSSVPTTTSHPKRSSRTYYRTFPTNPPRERSSRAPTTFIMSARRICWRSSGSGSSRPIRNATASCNTWPTAASSSPWTPPWTIPQRRATPIAHATSLFPNEWRCGGACDG
mmetsp:Transcript_8222/g.22319  ORF Transcript_8222/g.22319 Transcript_8222/m.22319 type:complete len:206 (-) Transcript_8222:147-764(-)